MWIYLTFFVIGLVVFDLLAAGLGTDSRDGKDWNTKGGVR
jgi:hypothetical protein